MSKCSGEHEIYVAEVVAVEKEGKIVVVTVCRLCDSVNFHEKVISAPHAQIQFLKDKVK